jgi:drug/metabolite transporter (DMT)-like permease
MLNNTRRGILLMIAATFIFAMQDGLSRHLAGEYNVYMVVMLRYWFFASFVVVLSMRRAGGLRSAAQSNVPWLQITRGVLLAVEIIVTVLAFVALGLIAAHAIFAAYPLIAAALSGPVLGEKVGWRRWVAIGIGFIGVLIILRPGVAVVSPGALLALLAAFMFAVYGLLTRYVARYDRASTSFFYTGVAGAVTMTAIGLFYWQPMVGFDWVWMGLLCLSSVSAHFLLIKAYEAAEVSAVQPFAYLQLVFVSFVGVLVFNETLAPHVVLGAVIVIGAGLFTFWRARVRQAQG